MNDRLPYVWTSIYFSCLLRHTTWWLWLPNHLPPPFRCKLIVRLKNKTMLEVSTCGMSPPMCALCACEPFMRVRWALTLIGNAKQADKKCSSWNWTNWTGGNGLVMLLWPLVDVEIYLMYFCSWQLLTVAIWLIQPMARLITLLEQLMDRQPSTVVTQATTWWEMVLALVKQKEIGLGVLLPVKVYVIILCVLSWGSAERWR